MPPAEARQLDPPTRERLIDYLKQDLREMELDPRLAQAAKLGMAGGGKKTPPRTSIVP